jgi:hypothetical protein
MNTNRPHMLANINLSAEAARVLAAGRSRVESLEGVGVALPALEGIAAVVGRFARHGQRLAGGEPDRSPQPPFTAAQRSAILADLWLTAAATLGILDQALQDRQQAAQKGPPAERQRLETEALLFGGNVARLVGQFLQGLDACGLPPAEEIPPASHLPTVEQPALPAAAAAETPAPAAEAPKGLTDTLPDTDLPAQPAVSPPTRATDSSSWCRPRHGIPLPRRSGRRRDGPPRVGLGPATWTILHCRPLACLLGSPLSGARV